MRTIGIVGGMSPESTVIYYERIVHRHQEEQHNHAYPRIVIASVSFGQYVQWQHDGNWGEIARGLQSELESVAAAGADFAILATNTMHKVLNEIRRVDSWELLVIAWELLVGSRLRLVG